MKIGLASCEYLTGNIIHKIDMLILGESFLHGFDGLIRDCDNDF